MNYNFVIDCSIVLIVAVVVFVSGMFIFRDKKPKNDHTLDSTTRFAIGLVFGMISASIFAVLEFVLMK